MCTISVAPVPKTCTPSSRPLSGATSSLSMPYESPTICPRASSRYRAMPTSNGVDESVSSSSVLPTKLISGMV
jgi:hypothetical protein